MRVDVDAWIAGAPVLTTGAPVLTPRHPTMPQLVQLKSQRVASWTAQMLQLKKANAWKVESRRPFLI